MDFIELAKKRYSVRKIDARKVEPEKVAKILEAGKVAPTAVNIQPQRILVIDSADALAKLKKCTPYHFDAPLAFIICYDKGESWKRGYDGADMGPIDASIVTTHMLLEIADLGLGATWVGYFDPAAVKEQFNLPDYLVPVAILPTGYPAANAKPARLHESRKDASQTIFYNSFDGIVPGKAPDFH